MLDSDDINDDTPQDLTVNCKDTPRPDITDHDNDTEAESDMDTDESKPGVGDSSASGELNCLFFLLFFE